MPPAGARVRSPPPLRFIYSYFAVYGDPLWIPQLDPYPDGLLQRLSDVGRQRRVAARRAPRPGAGRNGLSRVRRRPRTPPGESPPRWSRGPSGYGIGVYLYMNEPRAMPHRVLPAPAARWPASREGDFTAMCTSHPAVRPWMSDALAYVFREVPDLAGVFTITASENLTNCASHGNWQTCPRCKNRSDAEIIAEVNAAIEQGVHRGNPKAKVSSGTGAGEATATPPDIIARLPKRSWLMSVSEWALPHRRGGVQDDGRRIRPFGGRARPAGHAPLELAKAGRPENRRQGAVEQLPGSCRPCLICR